jgi:hypothetical protein
MTFRHNQKIEQAEVPFSFLDPLLPISPDGDTQRFALPFGAAPRQPVLNG